LLYLCLLYSYDVFTILSESFEVKKCTCPHFWIWGSVYTCILFCMYGQMAFWMIYLETWHFYLFKWWCMINLDIKSVWNDIPAKYVIIHVYHLYLFVFYFLKKKSWFDPQIQKWGDVHFFYFKRFQKFYYLYLTADIFIFDTCHFYFF
jgi:hypothetical protein